MAIDINDYEFYVRDIGIDSTNLNNIIKDVIRDIALTTNIFKYSFTFEILQSEQIYDFRALFDMNQRLRETLDELNIGTVSEEDARNFLINPDCVSLDDNKVITKDGYYDTLIGLDAILGLNDDENKLTNISDNFKLIKDYQYINLQYDKNIKVDCDNNNGKIKKGLCVTTVIPNLNNITEENEIILKPTIISGLRYYTNTHINSNDIGSDNVLYKEYFYAKNNLMNQYPTKSSYIPYSRKMV